MTDTTAITNIETALAELRDGKTTVEELGSYIGGMWQDAINRQDETAVAYYEAAWGLANALGDSNDRAVALVRQTAAERDAVAAQRDEVTAAYTDYQQAVNSLNFAHPTVGGTLRRIHQKAKQEGFEDGVEFGYESLDNPEAVFNSILAERCDLTDKQRTIFSAMLFGSLDGHLSHAVWSKLEQLIRDVVTDALTDNPAISDQYDFQVD
jgi:hypothetical protein